MNYGLPSHPTRTHTKNLLLTAALGIIMELALHGVIVVFSCSRYMPLIFILLAVIFVLAEILWLNRSKIDSNVVCRKDGKWSPDDISFLQDLENAKIKSIEGLHAKIYLNESTAIITSMNLYFIRSKITKRLSEESYGSK